MLRAMGRARRVARWIAIGFGVVALVAASWAVFWLLCNPRVPLAEPLVIERELGGAEIVVVLGGDFAPADAAMNHIRIHGYRYPYRGTAQLLREADRRRRDRPRRRRCE